MESENRIEKNEQSSIAADAQTSENRRKLIRGGLIGAPVLLALKTTPVLATTNCKLPSGFSTSGNLSRHRGQPCEQPATGPGWWPSQINLKDKFKKTGVPTSTPFNAIFGGTDSRSLLDVLGSGINFASLVVAAYLDWKSSSFIPGVSDADIRNMWNGTYKPPGSINYWTLAEGENYLRYVMGQTLNP